jgi:hypothetical protein
MAENKRVVELEDAVKDKDRRIGELREEIDELRDLVTRQRENADDFHSVIDNWAEAFDMVQTEDGAWTWAPFIDQHNRLCDAYSGFVHRWNNKYLPLINRGRQPVGRPLQASEAQVSEVLKLRKRGASLRGIADETLLGLPTVRTIVWPRPVRAPVRQFPPHQGPQRLCPLVQSGQAAQGFAAE